MLVLPPVLMLELPPVPPEGSEVVVDEVDVLPPRLPPVPAVAPVEVEVPPLDVPPPVPPPEAVLCPACPALLAELLADEAAERPPWLDELLLAPPEAPAALLVCPESPPLLLEDCVCPPLLLEVELDAPLLEPQAQPKTIMAPVRHFAQRRNREFMKAPSTRAILAQMKGPYRTSNRPASKSRGPESLRDPTGHKWNNRLRA